MSFASNRNSSWLDPDVVSDCADCPNGVCDAIPIGTIAAFGGTNLPAGWMLCNGSVVSSTTLPDLFKAIGTTWGVGGIGGDFNVPNLIGRTIVGVGFQIGLSMRSLADVFGEETHTITGHEYPAHVHNVSYGSSTPGAGINQAVASTSASANVVNTSTNLDSLGTIGSCLPHNNMQPSVAVNWMIKYAFFEGYVNPFDGSGVVGLTGTYP